MGSAIRFVSAFVHPVLRERPLVSARDFLPGIRRDGGVRHPRIAAKHDVFVHDAAGGLFRGALHGMHGVPWRGGAHAPPRRIVDRILFLHRHRRRFGGHRGELAGAANLPKLLGISAGSFGMHRGGAGRLDARGFLLVVQGASFAGPGDFRRRCVACATRDCSAMEGGGAVAAMGERLRSHDSYRGSRLAVCDGAPSFADGAVASSGPQRVEGRAGIAYGRLADSAEGGALPRDRVVPKFLRGAVGDQRRAGELSGLAVRRHHPWLPVSRARARGWRRATTGHSAEPTW